MTQAFIGSTPLGSEPGPAVAVSMEEVTDPSFPLLPVVKRSPRPPPPAQWSLADP